MRSFEFVEGTAAKFWEIERNGCDVTVRFGRVGARGQTSAKTLADEAAAAAHETKLINEKLRKGYAETSAPAASVPVPPAPVALSEPVPAAPAVVDEDAFVIPQAWARHRAARRSSAGAGRFVPAAKARATVAADIAKGKYRLDDILAARTTEESTRLATQEWLDGSPGARPLGAAVVAAVLKNGWWEATDSAAPWADAWVAERGVRFAAEAAVTLMALILEDDYAPPYPRSTVNDKPGVRHRRPDEAKSTWAADKSVQILLRVRQALAFASPEEHADAVAALRPYRQAHPYCRVAATVLVPEERAWFEEDLRYSTVSCHDPYLAALLLTAASTLEDAQALLAVAHSYLVLHSMPVLTTLIDGVGPAVAPALFTLLDEAADADSQRRLLALLAVLPGDHVTTGLIERVDRKYVTPVLLEHAGHFPSRTLRLLAEATGQRAVTDLLRAHLLKHRDLAVQIAPRLSAEAAHRIERILAEAEAVAPAPLSAVPPVLADPPWKHVAPRPQPVVVPGLTCADSATVNWLPGEREQWAQTPIHEFRGDDDRWEVRHRATALLANHLPMRLAALFLRDEPEEIARPVLARWEPSDPEGRCLKPVAARFELGALPPILALARRSALDMAPMLMPFSSPEIALLVADWLTRLKSMQTESMEWLLRHPAEAARALVPPALGKAGKVRRQAENALFALGANGHSATVLTAAEAYGEAAAAAVADLLATDPAALSPVTVPDVPAWASPGLLQPVMLRDGTGSLPEQAVANLVVLLAMSRLAAPYQGLETVRETCEPASLAAFAWSLFEQWRSAGATSRESWALDALGLLGDDETVRRLTPLILSWPGESGHDKAVTGLAVLAAIGTDVALMHLHSIAQRSKFAGLKNAARLRMERVAATLGLTAEQLADRLVPDFGLDPDGRLALDYGPRQFMVGFDEQLRPFVADAAGKRLKALPKPGVRDDATLAPAAYQRFASLRKDVRTVAADQVRRLEQAMVAGRRWSTAEFRTLFVDHPLLWHIVRRLVWMTFPPTGSPGGSFRVAEDRTLSTADDEQTVLADDAVVGVAHPLHLGDDLAVWGEVFADYEILQPFPQLGRPVLTLTEKERQTSRLARFQGVKVPTPRLLSMERRGWRRETPQDAGIQSRIEFTAGPGHELVVEIRPGIAIGYLDMNLEQELTDVFLHDGTTSRWRSHGDQGHVAFGSLDPVTASELLRDLTELTSS